MLSRFSRPRQNVPDPARPGALLGSALAMNDFHQGGEPTGPRLRLVWSNPAPPPPRRMGLDQAIERHLLGRDGLTDDAFIRLYAGLRRASG